MGSGPDDIKAQTSVPTGSDPEMTLRRIESIFRDWKTAHGPITSLGIASFGPVDLAPRSPTYGSITTTGKPGWRNTDVVRRMARAIEVPVGFDTDVNGAALAEGRWGAARGLSDFAYVTVGTGVGVGLMVNGRPAYGFSHPELGHLRLARQAGDVWQGACAFHGACVEGLASGEAIGARAGVSAREVPADSPIWETVAHTLGQLLHAIALTTAPRRILIGGGVVEGRPQLLIGIRRLLEESLNGYLNLEKLIGPMDRYVVAPGLGPQAGPLGALAIAADARFAASSLSTTAI
jgi:fructokinase